ncbi:MAG: FHA domain-containing protein [Anaerolineales bacterium]
MAELLCPQHGPYDSSYGSCPYCAGSTRRPQAPTPLEDDLPTDLGQAPRPGGGFAAGGYDDEAPTDIGPGRKSSGRILDLDDEEATQLGRGHRDDVTEIENVVTGAQAILWAKEGQRRGQILKVKGDSIIGRSEGQIILDDPKVSNPHAKLTLENDTYVLWDFGSKNGTFVNGERIRAATTLKENDTVKIGDRVFVFKILQ